MPNNVEELSRNQIDRTEGVVVCVFLWSTDIEEVEPPTYAVCVLALGDV